jgi:hypothetical protein
MGEHYLKMGEAEQYLLATYGIKWSRPTWYKYIRNGTLRGKQLGPRGWYYVSRESIDDFLTS